MATAISLCGSARKAGCRMLLRGAWDEHVGLVCGLGAHVGEIRKAAKDGNTSRFVKRAKAPSLGLQRALRAQSHVRVRRLRCCGWLVFGMPWPQGGRMTKTIKPAAVAVLGATGYAGAELLRLLGKHPHAVLRLATSRRWAGQTIAQALPATAQNASYAQLVLSPGELDVAAACAHGIDVVFACLPHGHFAAQAQAWLDAGVRVVDLSADFRLHNARDYPKHYHFEHMAPDRLKEAVYGLGSWSGQAVSPKTQLVANPGCYATAILLAALPAAKAGWLRDAPIVVNALSGVSGAGRATQLTTLLGECGNSVAPYKVGESHPHLGEIRQALGQFNMHAPVIFNPHLLPMARGILATVSLSLAQECAQEAARALYADCYAQADEIVVLEDGRLPETRFVRGSNRCDIAVRVVAGGQMLMVFAAIDNLLKGAAGQAVENFNRMMGHAPQLGLPQGGVACG